VPPLILESRMTAVSDRISKRVMSPEDFGLSFPSGLWGCFMGIPPDWFIQEGIYRYIMVYSYKKEND
jgi:hypothetical protein